MLVTCCWPNCEDIESEADHIKDEAYSSRTSQISKPSQVHRHHVSTMGSYFDATIVSQRVPNID